MTSGEARAAARISAGTAIVVALLTLIGSLGISVLTANLTAKQAADNLGHQLSSESEQTRASFLRDQRVAAYTAVLDEYRALISAEGTFVQQASTSAFDKAAAYDALVELGVRATAFRVSVTKVRLIGSKAMGDQATKVLEEMDYFKGTFEAAFVSRGLNLDAGFNSDAVAETDQRLWGKVTEFIAVARSDLGIPD